ncbi:LysR substrate-binding domain-containing protein [Sphingomonas sp. HT-1]|uniref:hydrogen peroxide-inducible genes activator n=1 Tax=unclassified Sphingomonas TaxID=196159 RepID=UPI0002D4814A|nr:MULTISPECIES: hydrogen peroxide-inducible genes activator [unclassified Sphingomonas]KTF68126.1 hyaluronan synthase [Sphingomonas sp. WG]
MPTLRQFHYLVTLADTGSFVRAARSAHVSQPTLSHQIKALEDRLGVRLLDRGAGGAMLTPVGRAIVAKAREVLAEVREIESLAARSSDTLTGTLKLGTTPTLGPYLLSPIVAELHRVAPDLHLYVREGIPAEQTQELSRGALDLLLGPMPIEGDELVVEPLFREPLHLVAAVDDPLAKLDRVDPALLRGRALLSLDPRHHFHRQCSHIAEAYGMRMTPDYEGTSLDSLHQMVASGLGMALLPTLYLASDVGGTSGLRVLHVAGWSRYRSIALAWRKASSMDAAFQLIAEEVRRSANAILARGIAADV